jgi:hypothetical protein
MPHLGGQAYYHRKYFGDGDAGKYDAGEYDGIS